MPRVRHEISRRAKRTVMMLDVNLRFARVISLGFYDGTTSGLAQVLDSSGDVAWCRYELVAWDDGQDTRVFCLGSIQEEAFESAQVLLSETEEPSWPVWFPRNPATGLNPNAHAWEDGSLEFTAVFVSDGYLRSVTAMRTMTPEIKTRIPKSLPNCSSENFQLWLSFASQQ